MASNTFKFLVTTDNHLGFMERDARRGDDSFVTFEECLRAAKVEHDVDAVLLAGDLFHENKPSLGCITRTLGMLRKYVPGDKPVPFSMLSDPAVNFVTHPLPCANFQDPNLNIALPIFIIHGNHDDPVGGSSSIDVLSSAGLVNYFGHVASLDDIIVRPILLQKGDTFVALYGMGNVRDERLHRCFRLKKVHFVRPKDDGKRKWFNILLFHQNRGIRGGLGSKGGIPESMLRGYDFDLVIWGNEHEQLMVPQPSEGFDVIQPGSTVMTSLSAGESNPKQYGILEVREQGYRLTSFPLRSIRPVVRRSVELWKDNPSGRTMDAVEEYLRSVADEMIEEAEEQIARIPDDVLLAHPNIKFPLMRLNVDFTDPDGTSFPQPNINRFGQQFLDIVVNAGDVLKPVKPKPKANTTRYVAGEAPDAPPVRVNVNTNDIRHKIEEVFSANSRDACELLSEPEVSAALYSFIEKSEKNAVDDKIAVLLNSCQKSVWKQLGGALDGDLKLDRIAALVHEFKKDTNQKYVDEATKDGIADDVDTEAFVKDIIERQVAVGAAAQLAPLQVDDVDDDGGDGPQAGRPPKPTVQQVASNHIVNVDVELPDGGANAAKIPPKKSTAKRGRDAGDAATAPSRSRAAKKEVPRLQLSQTAPPPMAMQSLLPKWSK